MAYSTRLIFSVSYSKGRFEGKVVREKCDHINAGKYFDGKISTLHATDKIGEISQLYSISRSQNFSPHDIIYVSEISKSQNVEPQDYF